MSLQNAFLGSLVADAVSMPVHWYYNRGALDQDYGDFTTYCRPRNPHPDSILWRSEYSPKNSKADILGNQLKYWGSAAYIITSFWRKVIIHSIYNSLLSCTVTAYYMEVSIRKPGSKDMSR